MKAEAQRAERTTVDERQLDVNYTSDNYRNVN